MVTILYTRIPMTLTCVKYLTYCTLYQSQPIFQGNYAFFNGPYHLKCNENSTNPTRVNALHGLLAGKKMTVEKQVVTDDYAELRLSYHFNGLEQGYPFLLNVLIVYRLSDSGFSITVEVTNPSLHGPLPFYVGWHPYFKYTAYSS